MSYTQLKAKPGSYIWDETKVQFVGRINKDGTEDKRFKKGGLCSLLNTLLEKTGYVPEHPQMFAERLASHAQTKYLVKGFGLVVDCITLSPEHWAAKAVEKLGTEANGIADILEQVSQSKEAERQAKVEALALIFSKELKRAKLSELVTDEDIKLTQLRRQLAAAQKEEEKDRKDANELLNKMHEKFKNRALLIKANKSGISRELEYETLRDVVFRRERQYAIDKGFKNNFDMKLRRQLEAARSIYNFTLFDFIDATITSWSPKAQTAAYQLTGVLSKPSAEEMKQVEKDLWE
jgi:hypothetical protein